MTVVKLIQAAFREGHLTEECAWKTIVLIPKGNGNFRGIGLLDVIWKTVTGIQFHDVLHRFRTGRGNWIAPLEAKPLQQLMAMREEVLHEIFLDLHKAYDALDRDRCLNILVAYRVGPRPIRLLRRYWDQLTMVARDGGYYGAPFKGFRGET